MFALPSLLSAARITLSRCAGLSVSLGLHGVRITRRPFATRTLLSLTHEPKPRVVSFRVVSEGKMRFQFQSPPGGLSITITGCSSVRPDRMIFLETKGLRLYC